MFEDADFADFFRGGLPYYLLIALPILILCSSTPVLASSEFTVHRMSQFDLNGVSYGCRASALNLEAKSLHTWSTARHCVVAKFQDISIDQYHEIYKKIGGLVMLLPKDISTLTPEEKEHLYLLEQAMLSQVASIPIYFSTYNPELEKVITDLGKATQEGSVGKRQSSALSEIFNSISANGYQIVVSGANHLPNKKSKIPIIQGELAPMKGGDAQSKLPLIILTANLKTFGLYNTYPLNSDAAVLLTIADLFSKLHNTVNVAPKYRLMFLISEAGPLLNFQGTKKWLDENVQLQNVDFVLCFDTITQPMTSMDSDDNSLYMHVSKPPKEGTAINSFYRQLKSAGGNNENKAVEGVHKKINLADTQLAWEHERFSMKRFPAFTISSVKNHKDPIRSTVFNENDNKLRKITKNNAKVIAESLARYIYNIDDNDKGEIFLNTLNIHDNLIESWMQVKSSLHNNDLKNGFEKYLKNVKIIYDKPDNRDPDFMLYDGQDAKLNIYSVKPAVFDLFLTILITSYLFGIYFVIQFFPSFYDIVCKMTKTSSNSNNSNSSPKNKSY